jgi:hypothetical protein
MTDLEDKLDNMMDIWPKAYCVDCPECDGEIKYLGASKDTFAPVRTRYEFVCTNCGIIHNYQELKREVLDKKWWYKAIIS